MLFNLALVMLGGVAIDRLTDRAPELPSRRPAGYGGCSGCRDSYGGTYDNPARRKAGLPAVTDEDYRELLDTKPDTLRKALGMPDFILKAESVRRGLSPLTKDIMRGDMVAAPGWFQKEYARRYYGGSVDALIKDAATMDVTMTKK